MSAPTRSVLERVARWAEEARAATTARDEAIAEAVAEGASQRAVARAAGLSHTAVQQIIKRVARAA